MMRICSRVHATLTTQHMSIRAQISEKDERGALSRKYSVENDRIYEDANSGESNIPYRQSLKAFSLHALIEIFLPSGFPACVTSGFGVGDEKASSTNAVLLTVFQDVAGRLATIFFAWRYGSALAPEAKMYRLAADIFNDGAFILDCLSPALPAHIHVAALCLSGAMRAVCGVCGGGAKAALSVHFANTGNVGELNAKDASQETVIGLLGMLCGTYIMKHVNSRSATWTALLLLLFIHLGTNYLAVRAVILTTLNRQRANIAYGLYRKQGNAVPTPFEVARHERIFEISTALREPTSGTYLGMTEKKAGFSLVDSLKTFQDETYSLAVKSGRPCTIYLCFRDGASPEDRLKAWLNALELAHLSIENLTGTLTELEVVRSSRHRTRDMFPEFVEKAKKAGWDLSIDAIVTQTIRPMVVEYYDSVGEKKRT
ncbi:hypothetical protein EW145_g4005 [Phellinidium pouzarii]|uniref:DUF647 domain-containing protein n=1 Tax=Phellinidium pouzarii TaxID=167371 RepID=A0A4V6S169_9AGAM|nr:hypothetical protein EW145_g4005 [Phellinidium pouzarii]